MLAENVPSDASAIDPKHIHRGWTDIYVGLLGFGVNTDRVKTIPRSWDDLLKQEYRGRIVMANPASSGTAFMMLATLIAIKGEDGAFSYFKILKDNIKEFTSSGSAPVSLLLSGEADIAVSFIYNMYPGSNDVARHIAIAFPREGTAQEISGVAVLKNAPNPKAADKFFQFAVSERMQNIYGEIGVRKIPVNRMAKMPVGIPDISSVKVISLDFQELSLRRDKIVEKWNRTIFEK